MSYLFQGTTFKAMNIRFNMLSLWFTRQNIFYHKHTEIVSSNEKRLGEKLSYAFCFIRLRIKQKEIILLGQYQT